MSATQLDASSSIQLAAFLASDPTAHVFGIDILERWGTDGLVGTEWWGAHDQYGALKAAAFAGEWREDRGFGLVVPMGDPRWAASIGNAIGTRGGAAWVVGELVVTDAVWDHMGTSTARIKSRQLLLEASRAPRGDSIRLRRAAQGDKDKVQAAARQMLIDDLGIDPNVEDSVSFIRSIETSIATGSEYVAVHDGLLVYRAKVGPVGKAGAQIGGIWVPPGARNRGIGQAGTRALVTQLLEEYPRVTLHVREDNEPAIRCYLGVGFKHVRDFRLLVR